MEDSMLEAARECSTMLLVLDEEQRILDASPCTCAFTGRALEKLRGQKLDEAFAFIHDKDDREGECIGLPLCGACVLTRGLSSAAGDEPVLEGLQLRVRRENRERLLSVSAYGLSCERGHTVLAIQDVTDLHVAQAAAIRNEQRLQSLYRITQYAPEGPRDFLDFALAEAVRLTGSEIGYVYRHAPDTDEFSLMAWYEREEPERDAPTPEMAEQLGRMEVLRQTVRESETVINEAEPGEQTRRVRSSMAVPISSGETTVAVVGVANKAGDYEEVDARQLSLLMDSAWRMVERRRHQQDLARERERARTYLHSASVMILVLDMSGSISLINQKGCEILGLSQDQIVGRNWFENFVPAEEVADAMEVWQKILAGEFEDVEYHENSVLRSDGTRRLIEWHNAFLRDEDGAVTAVVSSGTDITEKRELERQLRHAQKMEAVGRLAGGVAHEFNNILTGIGGMLHFIREDLPKDAPSYEDVVTANGLVERATALTRQLLAFSRRQTLELEEVAVNNQIQGISKMLRVLIGEEMRFEFKPGDEVGCVMADPGQLEQVLMNLAINARDAMEPGDLLTISTDRLTLDRAATRQLPDLAPGEYVAISVKDTGSGMDEKTLSKVFEPFFTTKGRNAGTGLGLSTCYGIIQQHEGTITVESTEGVGTTFTVYLPAGEKQEEKPVHEPRVRLPGGNETILLVEDEQALRSIAVRMLDRMGYNVITAGSAREAIETYEGCEGRIDLLLTDVVMPGASGVELYDELSRRRPDLPVLFMSGYAGRSAEGPVQLQEHLLQKPFDAPRLARAVREALNYPAPSPDIAE